MSKIRLSITKISLSSIVSDIDWLGKDAQMFMHKHTLVQVEVKIIREELETISKYRGAKKKHLQHGEIMSVAEVVSGQTPNEVDIQVRQETQQSKSQSAQLGPTVWQCRMCGMEGHNSRTCQNILNLSEDEIFYLFGYIYWDCG